jgi:DNA replication and repair protein RecF
MRIKRLRLSNVRNISELDVTLADGINWFIGPNGAGKTSLIEGAYFLSYGASFRTSQNNLVVKRERGTLTVNAEVERLSGIVKVGLSLGKDGWDARVNGDKVVNLAAALAEFALVCFEPGSHQLISGGSPERRRLLDWILFHVEQSYFALARDFRRVLRQRNELLRRNGSDTELDLWDAEFERAARPLVEMRETLFREYAIELSEILSIFLPELGSIELSLKRGWPEDQSLKSALADARERDRFRGHSTRGPHRADWSIRFDKAPTRSELSRGQEKLCALACVLAQARVYAKLKGEWPVVALDDFASELDAPHQATAMDMLESTTAQVLITGIEVPISFRSPAGNARMFHVEHGKVKD